VDLMDPDRQKRLLALVDVSDVWGVGRRTTEKLRLRGIHTALELANADPKTIRSELSVVMERTVRELNGVSCLDLECVRPTKQQIICSRSFGHKVTDKQELREAIAKYTTRAAEKLRGEKRLCRVLSVFIRTSPFIPNEPQYAKTLSAELPNPTDDTRDLLEVAKVFSSYLSCWFPLRQRRRNAGRLLRTRRLPARLIPIRQYETQLKSPNDRSGSNQPQRPRQRLLRLARRLITMVNEKRTSIASLHD
jgi:nucleotidyltransferase/DNA polymerase involved in DNA repair